MQPKLHRSIATRHPLRIFFTPGLPAQAWLLQAGVTLNFFGNGLVAPYLVIYLHLIRGIQLELAAVALGSGGILATISGLATGPLIDRFGARNCVAMAMTANAVAYGAYTLVSTSWQAIAVGMAVGIGTGAYGPSVQALLSGIVRPDQRAAALSQQRMSAIIGLSLGGLAGGLVVAMASSAGYTLILLLDSATFIGFAGLVLLLPAAANGAARGSGDYRSAVRDPRLRFLAVVNLVMVGAGIAPMLLLLPVFARGTADVPVAAVGLIYAVNTIVILLAQLRITRVVGRLPRRASLSIGACTWVGAWLLIAATGWLLHGWLAAAALAVAVAIYAVGECIYTGVVTPAAASMAPDHLRGRYLAVLGFAWQAGFMIGPPAGAALMGASPLVFPLAAAAVCATLAITLRRRGFVLDRETR